jgi:hypothetical protein
MGASEIELHIQQKIGWHNKLRLQEEARENYEECAKHRDEIDRLIAMLPAVEI